MVGVRDSSSSLVCKVRFVVGRLGEEATVICIASILWRQSRRGVAGRGVCATNTLENTALEKARLLLECSVQVGGAARFIDEGGRVGFPCSSA